MIWELVCSPQESLLDCSAYGLKFTQIHVNACTHICIPAHIHRYSYTKKNNVNSSMGDPLIVIPLIEKEIVIGRACSEK